MAVRKRSWSMVCRVSMFLPALAATLALLSSAFLMDRHAWGAADPAAAVGSGEGGLKIVRITPTGEDVPAGRQIVFEFDRPVVPLGRMERSASEVPISIEPALGCQWRWLNLSTLACQLNEKSRLTPSTRYQLTVRPGLKAEDGATLAGPLTHTFITERPTVSQVWFKTWTSPGSPQIGVRFNQPVKAASVADHVYFRDSRGSRMASTVAEDPEQPGRGDRQSNAVWLIAPKGELPPGAAVELRIEPGTQSALGVEPGIEDRVVTAFQTFPGFRFLGVECETTAGKTVLIPPQMKAGPMPRCNPSQGISLKFSSPAVAEGLKGGIHISPDLAGDRPDYDPWEDMMAPSGLSDGRDKGKSYPVYLPWGVFKPYTEYRLKIGAGEIKDEFGRAIETGSDMKFATDHLLPDFYLYKQMPVLEKGLDTEAPLVATNLESVKLDYRTFAAKKKTGPLTRTFQIPKLADALIPVPLEIRKLLSSPSGLVHGRLTSRPPVRNGEAGGSWLFAQVTPFHVHAKIGHHNTLVWVTDLQSGKPVAGVEVRILKDVLKGFGTNPAELSRGTTGADGSAELTGTAVVDPELKLIWSYKPEAPGLFVFCRLGDDMAIMPLEPEFQVASEGSNRDFISEWLRPLHGHIRTWGATAQGVYKAGDTVQYKIYVRDQGNQRFVAAPGSGYHLKVMDPMDKPVYQRDDVLLSEFGALDGEFTVPANGAVGWYRFVLTADFMKGDWEPMRVLISDFTPSPFKVTAELEGTLFGIGDSVKVTTLAKLHAGGPYANGRVRLTASVASAALAPKDPKLRGFDFDVLEPSEQETASVQSLYQTEGKLDDQGSLESLFTVTPTPVLYGKLTVESAVRDDRGKSVAARASATYVGRDRFVGLRAGDWILQEGRPARVQVAVVDQNGNMVPGTTVHVKVERKETRASRVKGAGNAYVTQYVNDWVEEASSDLTSGPEPQDYSFTPHRPGTYRITAGIRDTLDRAHSTSIQRWATGGAKVVWESIPGSLLNVYAEKEACNVGETARFVVQNPFPGAQALITVERYGVLKSWVKTFATSTEVVEVPILPDYMPGFYLSVVVTSPRVEAPVVTERGSDEEDLGKPAFRMGYAQVEVKDPYKEIVVQVKPEKEEYRPKDLVTVDLEARPRNAASGDPLPPMELAVVVLDDSVFDLLRQGRAAFDPYQGFYHLEPLDLANYNLLMQLVGRMKLEKKGANPGGGGGPDLGMRSVFKFVSYWNPSLRLDGQGRARIQFQLPDNLTGWRVLAMAVTPEDRMGLGETVFRVSQPTEVRPVLPNQLTEGDSFDAVFSVMNRTESARTVDVTIQAEGPIEAEGEDRGKTLTERMTIEPYKRVLARLPVRTNGPGKIVFIATAGDETDRDSLKQTVEVQSRRVPQTVAVHGSVSGSDAEVPVAIPEAMRPGSGRVEVKLAPTEIGDLEGAFQYLRDYPYTCWEQMMTRAVGAALYKTLSPYLGKTFSWDRSDEVLRKTPVLAAEHQAPNGGMVYYVPKNEFVDPYLSAYTALAFNWLRDMGAGNSVSEQVESKLHEYLKLLLQRDAMPDFYTRGMALTVRSAALAALAERGRINRPDVDRLSSRVQEMSLLAQALYLQALLRVDGTFELRKKVIEAILSHGDESGGTFILSEALDSRAQHILASPLRDNCAVLSALLAAGAADPSGSGALIGDIPLRLMRTIVQGRRSRGHWLSTQENLFAIKALADFSRIYETKAPQLSVQAWLDAQRLGEAKFTQFTDPPVSFGRNIEPSDLGRREKVRLQPSGEGRLYYSTRLVYSPEDAELQPVNAGIEIEREYSVQREGAWVLLKGPMEIRTGDVVRVDLYLSLPAERHFVVVEDPVPGGLEPVNKDLATASTVDADQGEASLPRESRWYSADGWLDFGVSRWSFYHRELRHDKVVYYSELLPPGRYHLAYAAQAVAPGEFAVLPTHAEEMYDPEVFGNGGPAALHVQMAP